MSDDLVKRLRAQHNDTWPLKIGHGDLINEDGPEAADRIEKLETEIERLQNIRHYGLRHIMRVQKGELPNDEIYGLPLIVEGNKVYPWPAENVELYAYWKRIEQ